MFKKQKRINGFLLPGVLPLVQEVVESRLVAELLPEAARSASRDTFAAVNY